MSMCIHRVIQELEEGANCKLPDNIKEYLIYNSSEFEIFSVLKGDPECYLGLFYEKASNQKSKIIQDGKALSLPYTFNPNLPAVLIYSKIAMLYLPS